MRDRSASLTVVPSRLAVPALVSGHGYALLPTDSTRTSTFATDSPSADASRHLLLSAPSSPSLDEPPASPWRSTFTPEHLKPKAPEARLRRTLPLAAVALVALSLCLLAPASLLPRSLPSLFAFQDTRGATCTAQQWSAGSWVPKDPPLTPNASTVDVLAASGFAGATQAWFKPYWFLHTKPGDWLNMGEYRWRAAQWRWQAGGPGSDGDVCRREVVPTQAVQLLQELVTRGGWLVVGDSLAEQHFFSLGCVLFPHVTVTWGAGWWEQNMYLAPDAPILSSLVLPDGFDVAKTPLITNLRSDHGFTKPELVSIYESSPHSADTPSSQLFTDYPVQSPSIDEYLARFFAPEHRYHALVFSTAAHFTPREFAFRGGQAAIAPFFQTIARRWVDVAREYLDRDEPTGTREIIVRGASSGHDACHERVGGPLNASETPAQTSYNWGEIPRYNKVFEDLVEKADHPRLSYLTLERPSQLRPDAHSEDCLHYAVGTGVFEGWTDYISYFLRSRWLGEVEAIPLLDA
ncbi:hypothetical protein DMC30DRAFT_394432 [Rhodotorula diobovata]|uniref:Uncharacterized protein n=1 Tax=Rhodotorula diobovata TaxID=5288 RepID=A0A5C5FZG3_9BASI|nr:hypothetical protein DMC30DRAFT_394432 [Rhodotorula diobovata]